MKNWLLLPALLLLARLHPASAAPDFEAARLSAVAANPPGVSLTLSLPPGRTQFRQGEVVPLIAAFTSDLPKAYRLNAGPGLSRFGDRELLWNSDTFQVDNTTGAVDPLTIYHAHELGWAFSGGSRCPRSRFAGQSGRLCGQPHWESCHRDLPQRPVLDGDRRDGPRLPRAGRPQQARLCRQSGRQAA